MTTFLLIRHAQTDWNAQGRWQGQTDMPLSALGRQQAQALAERLATWPLSALYSSDLRRAADTARAVAAFHPLAVQLDPIWRERHAGIFEGLRYEDIAQHYPAKHAEMLQGMIDPLGGESNGQLQARIVRGFDQLTERHQDGETVAIVSHGGSIAVLLAHVLELEHRQARRIRVSGNTGINRIQREHGLLRLTLLNDTAHLEKLVAAPGHVD